MSQPTAYVPSHSFISDSATLANFPGQALDVEFNAVKATSDQVRANLALIQRDDGALANASVDLDQLTTAAKAQLGNTVAIATLVASSAAAAVAATNAGASATAAGSSATAAAGSATAAATSATNAATSASNAAATLATAVVGPAASVDGEAMLYSGTSGKLAKRASGSGIVKWTSGVASIASAGADYQAADAQLFSNIPQVSKSAAYTTVLTDGQKHIFHPSADTTARIWTIDSNANVAYPIGTAITFINQHSAGVVTIAITTDTMRLAGSGTTGSRTLAADGVATAIKVTATEWIISGTGLS
jgi:hypothetical protein